jgi:hypothetical protein
VSGLNPQQTFLELLPRESVPPETLKLAEAFQYNLLAPLFGLHLALDQPPRYSAAQSHRELDEAFMVIVGLERMAQFSDMVSAHEKGELPPEIGWAPANAIR